MATEKDRARFWAKVAPVDANGCMLWMASVSSRGYAQFAHGGRKQAAHRFSYELAQGPIPVGLVLDHLCRVRHCVNPEHLEPVTNAENIRRGDAGRHHKIKTHCKHGHPYDAANTHVDKLGRRHCRTCALDSLHRHRAKKRAR